MNVLLEHRLLDQVIRHDWVVFAKRPFGGPATVLKYLARYTHRVAISNERLISLRSGQVSFRWKDYARGGEQRRMTLPAVEVLRRFLQHVLPSSFVKIRHYGFLSNRHRAAKLQLCRDLLKAPAAAPVRAADQLPLVPTDVGKEAEADCTARLCPQCQQGRLRIVERLLPSHGSRHALLIERAYHDTS